MKGRWRPANSEHAETEQVVGRDGGRKKKSDERHWGASARGPAERARARPPQQGHARTSSGARSLALKCPFYTGLSRPASKSPLIDLIHN
uniref:Uncharacterized protein n=1 Tax=Globodera pallida TaxID=36090 RepID=A0A183CAU3_GLOPA